MPENTKIACEWCNEEVKQDDCVDVQGDSVCQSCFNENGFSCYDCGENYHRDDSYTCDNADGDYCGRCFSQNFYHCGRCDNYYASGTDCDCDRSEESELNRIERQFTRPEGDTFGIEIEAEGGSYQRLGATCPKACGIHADGSLQDNGVEVVTPPMTGDLLEDYLHRVVDSLSGAGFKATERTGLHIHCGIDVEDMTIVKRIGKNVTLMNKTERKVAVIKELVRCMEVFEPVIYAMLPPSRLGGRWCEPITKRADSISKKLDRKLTMADVYDAPSRYHGLNLCALKKYGTVEFRYHSGSVDYKKIMYWVQIIGLIVRYAKRCAIGDKKKDLATIAETPSVLAKAKKMMRAIGASGEQGEYVIGRIKRHYPKHLELGTMRGLTI